MPSPIKTLLPLSICMALALFSCKGQPASTASAPSAGEGSERSAPAATNPAHLRVMSYNVLKYGDGCQDKPDALHNELATIVRYASPDILGLVKVGAPEGLGKADKAVAPAGFADDILQRALNAAFAGRYALCPATNASGANNINLLFYDAAKLGYAGMQTLVSDKTDFNLYRLYVKKSVARGKDTTFLYVIQNHTDSGDDATDRNGQMKKVLAALHKTFKTLPDVIDMGDFNLRNTAEEGYQALVAGADAGFRFADPPFALDKAVQYPADWEKDPEPYAAFLTTSTRKNEGEPNDCGTGGGAKFWFDHILLSPAIVGGKAGFSYIKGSYHTIGNDGQHVGRSITSDKHPNTAVPPAVADALFRFSNKYPVMLELGY